MDLNDKQRRFVDEYLVDLNATQAAVRAGYSAKTAHSQGPRLLEHVGVLAAIEAAQHSRSERLAITADQVLAELAKVALASLSDVTDWGMKEVAFGYDETGKRLRAEDIGDAARVEYIEAPFVRPINRDDIPEHLRAAVSEVSLGRDGFKIKMHDKVGALAHIGRHLGMFVDRREVSGPGGKPIPVESKLDMSSLTLEQLEALAALRLITG